MFNGHLVKSSGLSINNNDWSKATSAKHFFWFLKPQFKKMVSKIGSTRATQPSLRTASDANDNSEQRDTHIANEYF